MGHWYDIDGNPRYEVKGANGKIRPTTLRDARKNNWVPSVTTIMNIEDKPGLYTWKTKQLLKAAMENPFDSEMYEPEFWERKIIAESEKIGKDAATKGTEVHDALELYYKGETNHQKVIDNSYIVQEVAALLEERFPGVKWVSEASFSHSHGFGGKVDLHSPDDLIVLDFKTKSTDDLKKMKAFDQHHMQTAAYAVGLGLTSTMGNNDVKRYNLFISTEEEGLMSLTESTNFDREWTMFLRLLEFWQLKNNYVPEI